MQNFASVTRRVFCDGVVFSGGPSQHFTSSKCFHVGAVCVFNVENAFFSTGSYIDIIAGSVSFGILCNANAITSTDTESCVPVLSLPVGVLQ